MTGFFRIFRELQLFVLRMVDEFRLLRSSPTCQLEGLCSLMAMGWGGWTISWGLRGEAVLSSEYETMASMSSPTFWGFGMIVVGLVQALALFWGGPEQRRWAALFLAIGWSLVAWMVLLSATSSPSAPVYALVAIAQGLVWLRRDGWQRRRDGWDGRDR